MNLKFNKPNPPLVESDYIKKVTAKRQIVLHHTASLRAHSLSSWWNVDGINGIATAYGIDVNGDIYEYFPDIYWAYHTGNGAEIDAYNIGIEIANVGHLSKKGTKYYYWTGAEYTGEVYSHPTLWRGQKYFAEYTDAEYKATAELVKYLCAKHNIPKQVIANHNYDPNNKWFTGIVTHANVWSEKLDVSIAWDWDKFEGYLNATV